MSYIEAPKGRMLIFLGSTGVGKTTLCSALIPWAIKNFKSFRYWGERRLFQQLRSGIDAGSQGDYFSHLTRLIDDDFVMLDDFGSSRDTEWTKEIILDFIDQRYQSSKATMITSNLTRQEIYSNYGPRVFSRMFDKKNIILELHNGVDQRLN